MKGPAHLQRRGRSEEHACWIDQEEIRIAKAGGLNRPKDARWVAAGDPAENVARRKVGLVEEVRDIVCGDVEQAEAMKQVGPVSRSGPPCEVVVDLPVREGCGRAHLCV